MVDGNGNRRTISGFDLMSMQEVFVTVQSRCVIATEDMRNIILDNASQRPKD
jgi:hypothetical protein